MINNNDYSMYEYMKMRSGNDNRIALSYYGNHIGYDNMLLEIEKLSNCLNCIGVSDIDNVAICLPNIPNAIISFYAVNRLGASVNLIHPLVPPMQLLDMITKLNSKVLFLFDLFYEKHREVLKKSGVKVILCSASDYMQGFKKPLYNLATYKKVKNIVYSKDILKYSNIIGKKYDNAKVVYGESCGERIACYIHSGGTTGEPKIAMMPNKAINECSYNVRTLIGDRVEKNKSMLMVLPLFHVFGLGVCMHTTLTAGGRCLLVPKFSSKYVAKLVRKERATYMAGVPTMYEKLLNEKAFNGEFLKDMKCCYSGGDKLPKELKERFDNLMVKNGSECRLCEGYGLTEAGICTVNITENSMDGAVGLPLGNTKIAIVDKDNRFLSSGELGEICISGENVMSGYYGDSITSSEVLFLGEDNNTYVKTGDYGYISDSGHLFYVDRLKRMIKISGINVFPAEIERLVTDNIDIVSKCCAIESICNEKSSIKLFVMLKNDNADKEKVELDIRKLIKNNLMKYSMPKKIVFTHSLPMTEIGKVDYKKLTFEENLYDYK